MFTDLNVTFTNGAGTPINEYEPPRTDVLHYLTSRVNLDKDHPGYPGDRYKLVRRVRLVKTCQQWVHVHPSYDGGHESGQCTGRADYRRVAADQESTCVSLACLSCMMDEQEYLYTDQYGEARPYFQPLAERVIY